MPPRTRRATAPVVTPEPAETEEKESAKRGPGPLAVAHSAWIKAEYNVTIDPQALYLAQTTRKEFRASEEYQTALEQQEEAREQAAADRAQRAAARAATVSEKETDTEEAAPAPRARRGRAAAAAPAAEPEEAPAKPARRARAAKAAPAAETSEADTAPAATPARRSRKPVPF